MSLRTKIQIQIGWWRSFTVLQATDSKAKRWSYKNSAGDLMSIKLPWNQLPLTKNHMHLFSLGHTSKLA